MTKNRSLLTSVAAFTMALLFAFTTISVAAHGHRRTTPELATNIDGGQGVVVYSTTVTPDMEGQMRGVRLFDYTGGMAHANVAILIGGEVQNYYMNLRAGSALLVTVPNGTAGQELEVRASTNHGSNGTLTLEFLHRAEGAFNFIPGIYTAQSTTGGYYGEGEHTVQIIVDANSILEITVLEHHDTDSFFNRTYPGLANSVKLAQSTDVDVISGATSSSLATLDAIDNAIIMALADGVAPQVEQPPETVTELPPGTRPAGHIPLDWPEYWVGEWFDGDGDTWILNADGSAELIWPSMGPVGPVRWATNEQTLLVEFLILADEGWAHVDRVDRFPYQILDQDTHVIDYHGNDLVMHRVQEAVHLPAEIEPTIPEEIQETQETGGLPIATAQFTPGTFSATVPSYSERPLTLEGVFSENQILSLEVTETTDSTYGSGWALRSLVGVADQILVRQSTLDIDAFTGATYTRNAIIAAAEELITQAGANPADLEPQYITAPLPGDRFIPGFVEYYVAANTLDIHGAPITADTPAAQIMIYHETDGINLRISFGRNEFHVHEGGARGLGQGAEGHHESSYPGEIQGGTNGGFYHRQVAHLQANDQQSTHSIDVFTGATRSASAIIHGIEQAMLGQGATLSAITPINPNVPQLTPREDRRFMLPGFHTGTGQGFGGPISVTVTVDRDTIRRIVVEHSETDDFWAIAWPSVRDQIYTANSTLNLDVTAGATRSFEGVVEAVRDAITQAGATEEFW